MRYFLDISYKGTHYAGWQVQANAHAVQAELNRALSVLLREAVESTGAGRTDTGVHALQMIVHFDTEAVLGPGFLYSLNGLLPYDIAAKALLLPRQQGLHARFDAKEREYEYWISQVADPFGFEC